LNGFHKRFAGLVQGFCVRQLVRYRDVEYWNPIGPRFGHAQYIVSLEWFLLPIVWIGDSKSGGPVGIGRAAGQGQARD